MDQSPDDRIWESAKATVFASSLKTATPLSAAIFTARRPRWFGYDAAIYCPAGRGYSAQQRSSDCRVDPEPCFALRGDRLTLSEVSQRSILGGVRPNRNRDI